MYAYYIQMLKSISRSINKAMKRFNKSSPWLKALVLLILVLLVSGTTGKCRAIREGFIQEEKFVSESGPTVYDGFYSKIYDDLVHDKVKNEYEIGKIINTTKPTRASFILDVGSGTGHHVGLLRGKGYNAIGLDISPAMVNISTNKYPHATFKVGSALDFMLFPAGTFSHILCLYFTIYYIERKQQFFKNCYDWLLPGGYLVLHLVNRNMFDPILNSANPLTMVSPQKYAKKRITNSLVKFKDFQYKANFSWTKDWADNKASFDEVFNDDATGKIRKNTHTFYMESQKDILSLAKDIGFIMLGKIDLLPVQYEYQYLYILYKPE